MKGVLTGLLWLDKKDFSNEYLEGLRQRYTYPHPHEPNQEFSTYYELPDKFGIPYGNLDKTKMLLPKTLSLEDRTVAPTFDKPCTFKGHQLRDYQESATIDIDNYLKSGGTVFNLAGKPGSGKSFMLSYLLSRMKIKVIVIAHLTMLTTQLHKEMTDNLDADIRILDKDTLDLGDINIATSQFISKRPELWAKIKRDIGLIVIDEAESAASETTLRILQRAHARYRIFISATFSRSLDNRTEALIDLAGNHSIILERKDLLKPTVIGVACPEVFTAPPSKNLFKRFQTAFYRRCTTIDDKILKITQSALLKKRQVLIVTDIVEMQERYKELLENNGLVCGILNSKASGKNRQAILEDFDLEKIDVLIGANVLNAGLSIPKISVIVRVSFTNSEEKLEQLIGRALRDYPGKQGAWFIDLQFSQGVWKREQIYKQLGYKYIKTTWNKFHNSL